MIEEFLCNLITFNASILHGIHMPRSINNFEYVQHFLTDQTLFKYQYLNFIDFNIHYVPLAQNNKISNLADGIVVQVQISNGNIKIINMVPIQHKWKLNGSNIHPNFLMNLCKQYNLTTGLINLTCKNTIKWQDQIITSPAMHLQPIADSLDLKKLWITECNIKQPSTQHFQDQCNATIEILNKNNEINKILYYKVNQEYHTTIYKEIIQENEITNNIINTFKSNQVKFLEL